MHHSGASLPQSTRPAPYLSTTNQFPREGFPKGSLDLLSLEGIFGGVDLVKSTPKVRFDPADRQVMVTCTIGLLDSRSFAIVVAALVVGESLDMVDIVDAEFGAH